MSLAHVVSPPLPFTTPSHPLTITQLLDRVTWMKRSTYYYAWHCGLCVMTCCAVLQNIKKYMANYWPMLTSTWTVTSSLTTWTMGLRIQNAGITIFTDQTSLLSLTGNSCRSRYYIYHIQSLPASPVKNIRPPSSLCQVSSRVQVSGGSNRQLNSRGKGTQAI